MTLMFVFFAAFLVFLTFLHLLLRISFAKRDLQRAMIAEARTRQRILTWTETSMAETRSAARAQEAQWRKMAEITQPVRYGK
jgi:hypothetical protein